MYGPAKYVLGLPPRLGRVDTQAIQSGWTYISMYYYMSNSCSWRKCLHMQWNVAIQLFKIISFFKICCKTFPFSDVNHMVVQYFEKYAFIDAIALFRNISFSDCGNNFEAVFAILCAISLPKIYHNGSESVEILFFPD